MIKFIKSKKGMVIMAVAVVVVVAGFIGLGGNGVPETVSPVVADFVRTVKISGKVIPEQSVDLGFETSGIVSSISKGVGETVYRGNVLIRIDSSGIAADIQRASAELALAEAGLNKLEGASTFEAQISNSKQAIIQTIKDSYASAEDAVYNKTDQFLLNPNSSRPELAPSFSGYADLRTTIGTGRVNMNEVLTKWKILITAINVTNYSDAQLSESKKYLSEVSSYISDVARATTLFQESSSFSQSTIDSYRADTVTGRNNVNTASQNLISAEDKLKGLLLDVPAQVARVESARASLANSRSELSKTIITSPITGIVSKQDAKVGQVVSASTNIVSVISQSLEIEAFIPEVLISGVSPENTAQVTLDAYGDKEIFEAKVIQVDPAETIRDGVSTYKTRLALTAPDQRIRSGMTANVVIETMRKVGATLIPERAVLREDDGQTYLHIMDGKKDTTKIPVEIGGRDSMGNVELITNLPIDTRVIINAN